jgi:uncharacterized protein (DUF3084 family)
MTFWLVAIAIILVLILAALERGNSIKSAQVEAERERVKAERERVKAERERAEAERDRAETENELYEEERLDLQEQQKYDTFFVANGYPHRNDDGRVAAWAAQRGMSLHEAQEELQDSGGCPTHS